MTPLTDTTAAAVIKVAAPITISRTRRVSTPRVRASSSLSVITFMRQRRSQSGIRPTSTPGRIESRSTTVTDARLPSSQKVMAGSWL